MQQAVAERVLHGDTQVPGHLTRGVVLLGVELLFLRRADSRHPWQVPQARQDRLRGRVGLGPGVAQSRATIQAAAHEARCRDATLIAVMAYSTERPLGMAARPVATLAVASDERLTAETALRDAVADALGDEAGRVELRTALGLAGWNLVDTARKVNAQLIVLAGRGSTSMLLGTVSQYVLRRAPCPVLVVPES
jgi:nucleotide-binding universal stress UspA family protein